MTARLSLPTRFFAAACALMLSYTAFSGTVAVPAAHASAPMHGEIA